MPAVVSSLALLGACLAVLAWSAGRLAAAGRHARSAGASAAHEAAEQLEAARQDLVVALDAVADHAEPRSAVTGP